MSNYYRVVVFDSNILLYGFLLIPILEKYAVRITYNLSDIIYIKYLYNYINMPMFILFKVRHTKVNVTVNV